MTAVEIAEHQFVEPTTVEGAPDWYRRSHPQHVGRASLSGLVVERDGVLPNGLRGSDTINMGHLALASEVAVEPLAA